MFLEVRGYTKVFWEVHRYAQVFLNKRGKAQVFFEVPGYARVFGDSRVAANVFVCRLMIIFSIVDMRKIKLLTS